MSTRAAPTPGPSKRHSWVMGGLFGVVALAALVAGSVWGDVRSTKLNPQLVGWIGAAALLVFGTVATTRLSKVLSRHVETTSMPAAGGAVRIISAAVGYLIVIFGILGVLEVTLSHLLVGAGLAGIVLGIAAQQSLGNVFAGIVLILAKPFRVGDRIRVRSGALGGIFDARVREMALTYVTLQTDEGEYKVPNSAMLAAGVARTPRTPLPQPAGSQAAQKHGDGPRSGADTTASGAPGDGAARHGAVGSGAEGSGDGASKPSEGATSSPTAGPASGGAPSGGAPGPI